MVALLTRCGSPEHAVSGSANGDPRSNRYILNLSWWPQQNIDLDVQYTGYRHPGVVLLAHFSAAEILARSGFRGAS